MPQSHTRFEAELLDAVPFLRAFGRTLCGDPEQAEDLAQDAVVKALQNRAQFQPGSNLRAWLATILRNLFYSASRRRKFHGEYNPEFAERTLVAPDDPCAVAELEDVRRALAMLPAFQREALILVGAGGMSYEEAAQIAGVPLGTVKSRVRRARDELQAIVFEGRPAPAPRTAEPLLALVDDFDRFRARAA
ncbi:RNA polymerase subunit sigma-70 [Phenylobacterium hankyongense]|uniref:RNA polymerase sigma factor n=1 Tax=Phenylobacterium hankyongense TaxID=1813876 RepID=A0A328B356_9CAUL|nr:sigma-70 family RNA polymerase sigma factor [Phenylobacterium hankyongense]RAK60861.1 RNA polymerase subunit sigma-70 [Phenylobacterium hankyongense]